MSCDLTFKKIYRLTSVVMGYQVWLKRQSVWSLLRFYDACYYTFITRIAWYTVFQIQEVSRQRVRRFYNTVVSTYLLTKEEKMSPKRIILMSCGSYNPPTNMHLRMFEVARDHLHRMGHDIVVGGVISPVHDAYAKKELAPATHRCSMLRLALQDSDWIRLCTWETRQSGWTRTRSSLQYHQNLLNLFLFDTNDIKNNIPKEDLEWIPENIRNSQDQTPIQIKLLCGADLLESFGTSDLWIEEDIDAIVGQHGLVVITREGSNPNKFIYDSDILSRHMNNIHIVTEWIPNEVSSSKIRRAFKRGESVRYLLQDSVIDYVHKNGIYNTNSSTTTIKLDLTSPNANDYLTIDPKYQSTFLTPSPSDVTMESPSPIEIISIDVPDTVLRKNLQNATSAAFVASRQSMGLEEAREKFINAITAENVNAKHVTSSTKAAYPGQAKQIIATESGESQILDEVGSVNEEIRVNMRVPSKVNETSSNSSTFEDVSTKIDRVETIGPSDNIDRTEKTESGNKVDANLELDDNREDKNVRLLSVEEKVKSEIDSRFKCALSDFTISKDDHTYSKLMNSDKDNEVIATDQNVKEDVRDVQPKVVEDTSNDIGNDRRDIQSEESKIEQCVDETFLDTAMDIKKDTEEDNIFQSVELSPAASTIEAVSVIENLVIKNQESCEEKEEDKKKFNGDIQTEEKAQSSKRSSKRDSNLEIDGKYLKSVVNSRKSPRKVKDSQLRQFECISPVGQDRIDVSVIEQKPGRARSLKSTNSRRGTSDTKSQDITMNTQRCDTVLKGSLDSMIKANESKTTLRKKTGKNSKETFSKKSKSYESIKRIQEVYLGEPSKTDSSTSQTLITAEEFDPQTDEFCSICCYMNELTMRTEEEISSPNQETFYTLRSNCSSLEDSTECDICSSWNLQSSNEVLDRTILSTTNNEESLCEICEICGEVGDNMEFQKESIMLPRQVKVYQDKRILEDDYKILDNTTITDVSLEEDSFEIENCGLMSGTESMDDRGVLQSEDEPKGNEKLTSIKSMYSRGTSLKTREKYFVPKDELAILSSGSRKIARKGSLLKKKPDDHQIVVSQDKRRYSSADNLQLAKVFATRTDKCLRSSKSGKSTGSADNIRSSRNSSRRCKSLQRSVDNVRYLDSSTDNLDSLAESLGQEDNDDRPFDWNEKPKVRDNETVKMILTKHGIKIISEKETAL
ncbi:centrosome-associated protein 350 isoform X1 [Vespula squamosa]|uniref:Nicotinamide/nicotinic acid mononucleotide adenylyltransferase 3 n=1 Tax=Vespula squamosa TaxID=30214 RepID=A0ABD2AIC1_VESSQ